MSDTQQTQNKIAEIDKKIDMLSELINYGFGMGGFPPKVTANSKAIRQKYQAQLTAYKNSYGTAEKFPTADGRNFIRVRGESAVTEGLKKSANYFYANLWRAVSGPFNDKEALQAELDHILQERTNQEKFLQDQVIEQAEAITRQEEERIRLLQEQLKGLEQMTEQEKQKAAQELQKAKLEAEKARLAADLAKQGGAGNIAAGKTLLGTWESKVGTSPWVIAGIAVGAVAAGAIVFRILR
ncbi:hypothetical protein COY27_03915 [Candidatus Woesearchaeota archaeon CG_4_10_14_0_2_um_filter_33_13]|nr:MAG: hypothetical protein COY27_03915 [Candidatus Woesearchaeota archaeon CG_4_10_14_0_2_um_filter_33_13]